MRDNRSDGIIFWRPKPRQDLPQGTFKTRPLVDEDLKVKYPEKGDQLLGMAGSPYTSTYGRLK